MTVTILQGDCRAMLRTMPAASVDCVVTSPPYWSLRNYGTPPLIWGGDPACQHSFVDEITEHENRTGQGLAALGARMKGGGRKQGEIGKTEIRRGWCACGAWRGHYGLEERYQDYIQHTVEIFRHVYRVMRDDATLWLNLGDCFATGAGLARAGGGIEPTGNVNWGRRSLASGRGTSSSRPAVGKHEYAGDAINATQPNRMPQDLPAKNKVGIPWRVAMALQDDGWILRQEIIWHKLNPMPESICDRPTTAHEYVFLFAKSNNTLLWRHRDGRWVDKRPEPDVVWRHRITRAESRVEQPGWVKANLWRGYDYFYDAEAIMEPSSPESHARAARGRSDVHKYADGGPGDQTIAAGAPSAGRYRPAGLVAGKMVDWDGSFGGRRASRDVGVGPRARPSKAVPNKATGKASREAVDRIPGRSRKAHIEHEGPRPKNNANFDEAMGSPDLVAMRNKRSVWPIATQSFKGSHFATFPEALVEPCLLAGCRPGGTVLDPFGGSGTVGAVADRHQMNAVLIELNPSYVEMAKERTSAEAPLLGGIVHAGK